jgi:hypothetical protein
MAAVTKIGPSTPIQRRHAGDQPRFGSPTHRVAHTQHARIKKIPLLQQRRDPRRISSPPPPPPPSSSRLAIFVVARLRGPREGIQAPWGRPPFFLEVLPVACPTAVRHGMFPGLPAARTAAGGVPAQPASLAHAHCGGGSPDALAPAYLQPRSPDDLQQATSRAIFSVCTWTRSTGRKP